MLLGWRYESHHPGCWSMSYGISSLKSLFLQNIVTYRNRLKSVNDNVAKLWSLGLITSVTALRLTKIEHCQFYSRKKWDEKVGDKNEKFGGIYWYALCVRDQDDKFLCVYKKCLKSNYGLMHSRYLSLVNQLATAKNCPMKNFTIFAHENKLVIQFLNLNLDFLVSLDSKVAWELWLSVNHIEVFWPGCVCWLCSQNVTP